MSEVLHRSSTVERLVLAAWLVQQVLRDALALGLCVPLVCHWVPVAQKRAFGGVLGCCQDSTFLESLRGPRSHLYVIFLLQVPNAALPTVYERPCSLCRRLLDRLLATLVVQSILK